MTTTQLQIACISWSTADGNFGLTDIHECVSIEDAAEYFMDHVRGKPASMVPAEAEIDTIRIGVKPFPFTSAI